MKKLLLSVIVLSVTFCFSTYAQYFRSFNAREGIDTARETAILSGLDNPKLISIMTSVSILNVNNTFYQLIYDINTGATPIWYYVFANNNDTTKKFGMTIVNLGILGILIEEDKEVDLEYSNKPINLMLSLENTNWFNSDSLASILRGKIDFMKKFQSFKDLDTLNLSLMVNIQDLDFSYGEPCWSIELVHNDTVYHCLINAITGDMKCEEPYVSSIAPQIKSNNEFLIYPNPANDFINIRLPETSNNLETQFSIFDIYGRELERFSSIPQNKEIRHILDQKVFSNGVYYLHYSLKNQNFSVPFVIER